MNFQKDVSKKNKTPQKNIKQRLERIENMIERNTNSILELLVQLQEENREFKKRIDFRHNVFVGVSIGIIVMLVLLVLALQLSFIA